MKNDESIFVASLAFLLLASGCIVRTYSVVKERPDLEIAGAGNQGYLVGSPSETKEVEKKTRTTYVAEIEVGPSHEEQVLTEKQRQEKALMKAGKYKKVSIESLSADKAMSAKETAMEENYVGGEEESVVVVGKQAVRSSASAPKAEVAKVKTYTVKSGDTLEKIAARPEVYGNKKKWYKIYKANESQLKEPNRILPGQVLNIPE